MGTAKVDTATLRSAGLRPEASSVAVSTFGEGTPPQKSAPPLRSPLGEVRSTLVAVSTFAAPTPFSHLCQVEDLMMLLNRSFSAAVHLMYLYSFGGPSDR